MKRLLVLALLLGMLAGRTPAQQGCNNAPGTMCFLVSVSTLQPSIPPIGGVGVPYSQTFTANGATSYSISSGTPTQSGLTLNVGSSASITGTPTAGGQSWVLGWSTSSGNSTATLNVDIGSISTLTVSPSTANLNSTQTQNFTASAAFNNLFVSNVTTLGTWSNTGGTGGCTGSTIGASTGVFTAGSTSGTCLPQISFDSTTATATVTVTGSSSNPISFQISDPLPNGQIYQTYSESASGVNGSLGVGQGVQLLATCPTCTAPYTWTLTSGTLPTGITLSSAGVLSGTPTASGSGTSLTFHVADSASHSNSITLASGIAVASVSTVTAQLAQSSITANTTTNVTALGTYSDSSTAPIPNGMGGVITYAASVNTVSTVASSVQVAPAIATTTGDFAIGIATSFSASSFCNAVTATITSPNETFHAATTAQGMTGAPPPYYNCYQMFYAYNITGNAADAPTCNWTSVVGSGCLIRYYRGMPTTDPLDQHPTPLKATSVTACTPTAVTTVQANELLEFFCGPNSATTINAPSGFGDGTVLLSGGVPYGQLSDASVNAVQTSYAPMGSFTPGTNEVTLFSTFKSNAPANGTVTWSSATPTCATVASTTGLVTGQSITTSCTSVISPTFYGSGSPTLTGATVTVNPSANPDTAIIVKPSNATVANTGTPSNCSAITCQFSATGNNTGNGYTASWGSSNTSVANVDPASGLATCTSTPGSAIISATVSGFSSSTPATLNCVISNNSTINATDCSSAQFLSAWNQLGQGTFTGTVTIKLPSCGASGTSIWSSSNGSVPVLSLSVPASVTNLTVQGNTTVTCTGASPPNTTQNAGYACVANDLTNIVDGFNNANNGVPMLKISTNGTPFRITGITVQGGATGGIPKEQGLIQLNGSSHKIRLDHNHFNATTYAPHVDTTFWGTGGGSNTAGVVDHSRFEGANNVAVHFWSPWNDTLAFGDGTWAAPTGFGLDQAWFVENNDFTPNGVSDCVYAGHEVIRYNHILVPTGATNSVVIHPTDTNGAGRDRSCRAMEVYNNYFSGNSGGTLDALVFMMGGTALVWGNAVHPTSMNWLLAMVDQRSQSGKSGIYHETSPPNGWGACGTQAVSPTTGSAWDGNQSAAIGWPCLDGIGRGQTVQSLDGAAFAPITAGPSNKTTGCRPVTPATCNAWPQQYLEPVYEWSDQVSPGGLCNPRSNTGVTVANRDFYCQVSASANTTPTSPFNGTVGTGYGPSANKPTSCTAGPGGAFATSPTGSYGVAYFDTQANGGNGELFVCTAANVWTPVYTPFTYPHPLDTGP